jgi:hypothetical protein
MDEMIPLEVMALSPYAHQLVARQQRRRGRRFRDHHGRAVEVGEWQPQDWDGLLAMYGSYDPAQRAQGLPPLTEPLQAVWVDKLLGRGPNVVARTGGRVVGHAAVVAYDRSVSHQLVLFVHQDYHGAGIDGALADAMLRLVRRQYAKKTSQRWADAIAPMLSSTGIRLRGLAVRAREIALGRRTRRGAPRVAHLVADLDEIESPPPRHRAA